MASSSTAPAEPSQTLSRGAACLPCRKRKMRCDGAKPVCGQCISKYRPDDCEYTDGSIITRSQMLEENIALLESRIRELEHPDESAPSVRLFNPHSATAPTAQPSPAQAVLNAIGEVSAHATPAQEQRELAPVDYTADTEAADLQVLWSAFMRHASQLGFFINGDRFLATLTEPPTQNIHLELRDALLNAVLLWGCRLSSNPALIARQDTFLSRAISMVSSSMFLSQASMSTYTHDILYVIQAEILLSNYFFANGQLLEGRYHCTAAVSLAISCRLNRMDGHTPLASTELGIHLAEPADSIQAGERIDAFWAVYVLDNSWAIALGTTPTISTEQDQGRIQIVTPWSTTMVEYQQGLVPCNGARVNTMREFLLGPGPGQDEPAGSTLCIRTKAVALCERANWLAAQYRPDMPDLQRHFHELFALENRIARFTSQLAHGNADSAEDPRATIVARSFAAVAVILLHRQFTSHDQASRQKCLVAANAVVTTLDGIDVEDLVYLDAVMAHLWTVVCKTLIDEAAKLRLLAQAQASGAGAELAGHAQTMLVKIDQILAIMNTLANRCPLMGAQMTDIRQAMTRSA